MYKKIVAAHSIQNNRHLIKLADKGVVMQIKAVDAYFTGDATRVGRKIATTFNGFCSEHDNSLFKPIEEKNYNLNNKEQEFLLAYRAFAREYFVKKSVQLGYQKAQTKYPNDNYIKDFLEGTKIGIRDLDFWKDIFDKALLEKDYNQISTMSFIINKKCNLAVSSIFDIEYDFEGNSVNDLGKKEVILKPLFLTVFPQDNKTVILTSYFKKDKQSFNLIEKQLSKFNEDILLEKISLLIALYCENFIFAPKKWETMNKKQKDEFLKDFLTKGPGTIKSRDLIDKPKFNLFF